MRSRFTSAVLPMTLLLTASLAHAEGKIVSIELEAPKNKKDFLSNQIDVPPRFAVFEMNPVEGAIKYQLQIQFADKAQPNPREFEVLKDNLKMRLRLNPGKYQTRTRAIDAQGLAGKWSAWESITVDYKAPSKFSPLDGTRIAPKSDYKEKYLLEWPDSIRAFGYLFVLKDGHGNLIRSYKTQKTWTYEELNPGLSYRWTAWPIRKSQWERLFGDETLNALSYKELKIDSSSPALRKTAVYAEPVADVDHYEFEFLTLDLEGRAGTPSFFHSANPELQLELAPDNYEIRSRAILKNNTATAWSLPQFINIPFEEVRTIEPAIGYLFEPFEPKPFEVDFSWRPQPGTHSYGLFLYDKNGTLLHEFKSTEPKLSVRLAHDVTYYWKVIALSEGQSKMDPPKGDDKLPYFTVNKYVRKRLVTAEEPSYLYAWGRYWASRIDYEGYNYDLDSIVRQPINGATGEAAIGYWNMATSLGLMTHASLSGFNINNKVYNYAGGGVDLGYRYTARGGSRLRIWLGGSYRELPEFLRLSMTPDYDYHRIKSFGPRLQISYMKSFEKKPEYGYHVYGVVYRSEKDLGTPNNRPQIPETSYTLGVFGTYKWTERTKLQVGYSYKLEAVSYESGDRTARANRSVNEGHFLNLSIEYGLVGD